VTAKDDATLALLQKWETTIEQLDAAREKLDQNELPTAVAILETHSATLLSCANELRVLWQGRWTAVGGPSFTTVREVKKHG